MKNRIAIIGSGELGRQVAYLCKKNDYNIVGFFDDVCKDKKVDGFPIFGTIKDIPQCESFFDTLVMAIGYKHFKERKEIFENLNNKYRFETIIDKTSIIDPTAKINAGTIIYPGVLIDKEVCVEENVLLNVSVTVGHNSVVGAHSFVCGGALFAGRVTLGHSSFVGIHASLSDDIEIASHTVIGAHTLVIRNIEECGGYYIGVPAKKIVPKHGL